MFGPLTDSDGKLIFDDRQNATLFNNFFGTVGTVDDGAILMSDASAPPLALQTVVFSPDIVLRAINKLKPKLSVWWP